MRYGLQRYEVYTPGRSCVFPRMDGGLCRDEDLARVRLRYRMALLVLSVLCGVLAVWLIQERAARVADSSALAQRQAAALIEQAEAHHRGGVAEVGRLTRNLDQVSGKLDGALRLNANLAAQVRALNQLVEPARQAEALRLAGREGR